MKKRHIHFIGIGGIGVSGIAHLVLKQGEEVSGSDIKESAITRKLASLGARIYIGHRPESIEGADLVVYSSAIQLDNPEMTAARKTGVPIRKRAEFLSELMKDKKVITVTGAHGKTTTSSLAATLLIGVGLNPTIAVGGILRGEGDNAKLGGSDYFVAEADESDGTFLCYQPAYSIITNIDHEHMNFYKTYDNLLNSFSAFVAQTKKGGCVFYYNDDAPLKDIVLKSNVRSVSFGFSREAGFYPENIFLAQCRLGFSCIKGGHNVGEISLALMGRHNILNCLAVIALGFELGLDFEKIKYALSGFKGVERRFQVKYEDGDILIVDDYAHHPSEIAVTIEAAKVCPRSRLIVVFQPHRYTRTKLLMDKFAKSFIKSDRLIITDVYAASEEPIESASAQALAERVRQEINTPVDYIAKDQIVDFLRKNIRRNDMVLFLGAGDITKVSDEFTKRFKK
ncbi:MAG: UDP-N-acetylmuramate--L-alanine ligase [Candidatus Omnitrophica bacterium CG1_02_44_16]|nr:MAG: UDP-N-acetylmuramate--L-alanine ligase [Candidatus Omnitrophica bacterium CG1_02_44_16]